MPARVLLPLLLLSTAAVASDPRRAETALEEMADLFRVLMRENADLVPLSEEIQVARPLLELGRLAEVQRATIDDGAPEVVRKPLDGNIVGAHPARGRRTGVALDNGEFDLEVRCAAVSVHDFTGGVVGAIGISGPIWRLTDPIMQKHAKAVTAAASRISQEFGRRPHLVAEGSEA